MPIKYISHNLSSASTCWLDSEYGSIRWESLTSMEREEMNQRENHSDWEETEMVLSRDDNKVTFIYFHVKSVDIEAPSSHVQHIPSTKHWTGNIKSIWHPGHTCVFITWSQCSYVRSCSAVHSDVIRHVWLKRQAWTQSYNSIEFDKKNGKRTNITVVYQFMDNYSWLLLLLLFLL